MVQAGLVHRGRSMPKFVVAGDVFHTPAVSPELMNMVIGKIPAETIGVAGNHDLPHHSMSELEKCSLGTLHAADCITLLWEMNSGELADRENKILYAGFNWGEQPRPQSLEARLQFPRDSGWLHVAVVHAYVWMDGHAFPGVTADTHAVERLRALPRYDLAVFGDNHQPFKFGELYNHGAAQRRRMDEREIKLGLGLLWDDGLFEILEYNPPEKWVELPAGTEDLAATGIDAGQLLQVILDLAETEQSFEDAMKRTIASAAVPPAVRKLLADWLQRVAKRIG